MSMVDELARIGETSVLNKWYRACRNDTGEVWCESRNPNEVYRMSEGVDVTFYSKTDYRVIGPWELAGSTRPAHVGTITPATLKEMDQP